MRSSSIHGASRPYAVVTIACVLSFGCISESREGVDADAADVVETLDTGIDEVEAKDTEEAETLRVECDIDAGCDDLAGATECIEWRCVNKGCELVPRNNDGACDDGDECTVGDICRSGVCLPGTGALNCALPEGSNPCLVGRCSPESGCFATGALPGTVCDNGTGQTAGACVADGFVPTDVCDGLGTCVDQVPGAPGPATGPRLEGEWFGVYTSLGVTGPVTTTRAVVDITTNSNAFEIKASQSFGASIFGAANTGFICTASDGFTEARLSLGSLIGRQLDQHLAIVSSPVADGAAMWLRADEGIASMVDGKYNYVQTSIVFGAAAPVTWHGSVTFDQGCLTGGAIETDPTVSVGFDFIGSPEHCLSASELEGEAELVELSTRVRAQSGDSTNYPIFFRGAIGRNGDVLLMVKEDRATDPNRLTPEYGVVIMVREPQDSVSPATMVGDWAYSFQSRVQTNIRRDVGVIEWAADGVIRPGTLSGISGDVSMSAGWYITNDAASRISQRISVDNNSLYQFGFIAPSRRFVVGWGVASTALDLPVLLGDTPHAGSLLLMLRP